MLLKENIHLLRLLSGAYGLASMFLPWLTTQSYGYVIPLPLWYIIRPFPRSLDPDPWIYVAYPAFLAAISVVFTVTLSTLILGCISALLSSITSGMKGRLLIFSAGIEFSLAPIIFVLSFSLLLGGLGTITARTPFYSTGVASGFFMAFVAAVPAFVSLCQLRHLMFFLAGWTILTTFSAMTFLALISTIAPDSPMIGVAIFASSFFSFIVMCASTLVYGVYKLLKEKIHSFSLRQE